MEPPPPSLEAMVQPRLKRPRRRSAEPSWLLWKYWRWVLGLVLVLAGVALLLR
jgi:hypothetical protein